MTISPYSTVIPTYNITPYVPNLELEARVLMDKQSKYDTAYAGIQKLRQESLNINFLNQKEQKKIDSFNNNVNNLFNSLNGELGDLSSRGVVDKYTSLFQKIGNDPTLIGRYRKDKQYQRQLQDVYKKRDSKDPKKAGYSNINHLNYERRLQKYAQSDLDRDDVVVKPYQNYIDYNKGIRDLVKEIPEEEIVEERIMGDGRIAKITRKGKNPAKVSAAINQYLGGDAASQLSEEAEFYFYNNQNQPGFEEELYSNYSSQVMNNKEILQKEKKKLSDSLVGLTGNELINATNKLAEYERDIINLDKRLIPIDEFMELDEDSKIANFSQMYKSDLGSGLTNVYGGYTQSVEYNKDDAFWANQNLKLAYTKESHLQQFRQAQLNLDQANLGLKQQELDLKNRKQLIEEGKLNPNAVTGAIGGTSEAFIVSDVSKKIIDGITNIHKEQKDYLDLGINSKDVTIKNENEIERLKFKRKQFIDSNKGGGLGFPQDKQLELDQLNEQIAIEENRASTFQMSPLDIVASLIKDPTIINSEATLQKAPAIIAVKEALKNYQIKNELTSLSDIPEAAYESILNDAKTYKTNPNLSQAHKIYSKNQRAITNVNAINKKAGVTKDLTPEQSKLNLESYLKNDPNMIGHYVTSVDTFDWKDATGDNDKGQQARAENLINEINQRIIATGDSSLDPKTLTFSDIRRVEKIEKSGDMIITFNPDKMGEDGNLTNRVVTDIDGNKYELTPETPNVILRNPNSTASIENEIVNMISDTDNLYYPISTTVTNAEGQIQNINTGYRIIKNTDGTFTVSVNGNQFKMERNGRSDEKIHNDIETIIKRNIADGRSIN